MESLLPSLHALCLSALSIEAKGGRRGEDNDDGDTERRTSNRRVLRSEAEQRRAEQRAGLREVEDTEDLSVDNVRTRTLALSKCLQRNYGDTEEDEDDPPRLEELRTALRNAVETHKSLKDSGSFDHLYTALVDFSVEELKLTLQNAVYPMVDYAVQLAGQHRPEDQVVAENAISNAPMLVFRMLLEHRKDGSVVVEAYGLGQERKWAISEAAEKETKLQIEKFFIDSGSVATRDMFLDEGVKAAFALIVAQE